MTRPVILVALVCLVACGDGVVESQEPTGGTPTGRFERAAAVELPSPAIALSSVGIVDLDQDGRRDVVFGSSVPAEPDVYVGLQLPTPSFTGFASPHAGLTTGDLVNDLLVGDFSDQEGDELVIATDTALRFLRGTASGELSESSSVALPRPVALARVDMGGGPVTEIAAATSMYDTEPTVVIVRREGATWTKTTPRTLGDAPSHLTTGDLDGNGVADVVVSYYAAASLAVLLRGTDGSLGGPTTFATGGVPDRVALGDVNGDGALDVVVADRNGGPRLLVGRGDGTLGEATSVGGSAETDVVLTDVDDDGDLDLVAAWYRNGPGFDVFRGDGTGRFDAEDAYPLEGDYAGRVQVTDVTGDGVKDVCVLTLRGVTVFRGLTK